MSQSYLYPFLSSGHSTWSLLQLSCISNSPSASPLVSGPAADSSTYRVNRYSMPVTKSRSTFYDIDNLDQANTTGFLFRDDESAPEGKLYTKSTTEDSFSTLIRQNNMVSGVSSHSPPSLSIFLAHREFQNKTASAAQSIAGQLKTQRCCLLCDRPHFLPFPAHPTKGQTQSAQLLSLRSSLLHSTLNPQLDKESRTRLAVCRSSSTSVLISRLARFCHLPGHCPSFFFP